MFENYSIIRLAGHPIIALPPGTRRMRAAGASQILGFTMKRAIFRNALRAAAVTGLDRLISESSADPMGSGSNFDFTVWLRQTSRDIATEVSAAAVIWPWPPGSYRGRIYVHMLGHSGHPVAFSKISLDKVNDDCLIAEARMLKSFEGATLKGVKVPALLSIGSCGEHRHLTVGAIPNTVRPVKNSLHSYPASAVAEFSGSVKTVDVGELSTLNWWKLLLDQTDHIPGFVEDMMAGVENYGIDVCRVHGDFGPKNLMMEGSFLWVFDWERGSLTGPRLTDRVGYYTSVCFRDCQRRPLASLHKLLRRRDKKEYTRHRLEVGMALGFLHSVGSAEATQLLRCWPNVTKDKR
jgi:hypothetical protein